MDGSRDRTQARLPDGYRPLRRIGSGRHGTVTLCRAEATGREAAVAVLDPVVEDAGARLAAHCELLAAGAAAAHPCSVPVEEAGFTAEHRPYLVRPFCPGVAARSLLAARGAFPVAEALAAGARAALSLAAAHRRGVLHLDVRPARVLFDAAGDALLTGHGVGRILRRCAPALGVVADPAYCGREFFGWEAPGPPADVHGLGATLHALLDGMPPRAEAGAALYGAVLGGEPVPLRRRDVPARLPALLGRMTAAAPQSRPPLSEVYRELRRMLPADALRRVPAEG